MFKGIIDIIIGKCKIQFKDKVITELTESGLTVTGTKEENDEVLIFAVIQEPIEE